MSNIEILVDDSLEHPKWLSGVIEYCEVVVELVSLRNCGFTLLLSDAMLIQELNFRYRGVNSATDVLSFPQFPYGYSYSWIGNGAKIGPLSMGQRQLWDKLADQEADQEMEYLGDIIVSLPQATLQAPKNGHSTQEEVCHLAVHGLLHLLGYDHALEPNWQADSMLLTQSQITKRAEHYLSGPR